MSVFAQYEGRERSDLVSARIFLEWRNISAVFERFDEIFGQRYPFYLHGVNKLASRGNGRTLK
jgi:hypothetical protein